MPLHYTRYERRDGVDRDAMGKAALQACRVARGQDGVQDARFYWADWDTVAVLVHAAPGKWGVGSGQGPIPEVAKAGRQLQDLARLTSHEVWAEAGMGEQAYRASQ